MKIKPFVESGTVVHQPQSGLLENRAGRISPFQRRMIRLRLYEFSSCGMILLELVLLTVFIVAILITLSRRQDFPSSFLNLYTAAGIFIPPWIALIYGRYAIHLLQDMRSGVIARDCGTVRLEVRRLPPYFRRRLYVVLDGTRRYEADSSDTAHIHEGERCCIYYTPHTRLVTAVDIADMNA